MNVIKLLQGAKGVVFKIRTDYFLNLINAQGNEDKRNRKYLDISEKFIK